MSQPAIGQMMTDEQKDIASGAATLLSARAVRARADAMFNRALAGELAHFTLDMNALDGLAAGVFDTLSETSDANGTPFYACWRAFEAGGHDRWAMLGAYRQWDDVREMGRTAVDLAFLTAILGADPGPQWSYREAATGEVHRGAQGLAIATLAMLAGGVFSADPADPLRADATALARLGDEELASGLQHGDGNELAGFEGRGTLLRRLGEVVAMRDVLFSAGDDLRPGCLFDTLMDEGDAPLAMDHVLEVVLDALAPIWPERVAIDGIPLGDTWRYTETLVDAASGDLIPLHTMAQKLALSLVEPLLWAGIEVAELDGLTGLADLAHGGLLIDADVMVPRDPAMLPVAQDVDSPFVLEWRSLTVAVLDRLAVQVRTRAGLETDELPLACVMQGGTVPLAREIALEKRDTDRPPLGIATDGTVI